MAIRLLGLVLLAATVAACSVEVEPVPTLAGFSSTTISIDDRKMAVAVADTFSARHQGLMGVTDLGELDGMLFAWEFDTPAAFWMKDTLMPLDIAFFGVDGGFIDRLRMEPCTEDPCPSYSAAGPYRYAIEAPAGDLGFVGTESVLVLDGGS